MFAAILVFVLLLAGAVFCIFHHWWILSIALSILAKGIADFAADYYMKREVSERI